MTSHVRHIRVPKQKNGGHVGVPNQSCGNLTFFDMQQSHKGIDLNPLNVS